VVRRARRRRLDYSAGMVDEPLTPSLAGALELLSCRLPPGASSGDTPYKRQHKRGRFQELPYRGGIELAPEKDGPLSERSMARSDR
jgi:hypothetical protein